MATLTRDFQRTNHAIHVENHQVLEELRMLDHALDRMQHSGDMFDRLATAKEVEIYGKWLAAELPDHFLREERNLLDSVADISPQLSQFCTAMKQQHRDFSARLDGFNAAIRNLEYAEELEPALAKVADQGKQFTHDMRAHIQLEEEELSGFL